MPEKNPESPHRPSSVELLHELARVVELTQRAAASSCPQADYALVRPVCGLDSAVWEQIAAEQALAGWLTVPLNEPQAQALKTILAEKEHLAFQRDHDSLTGIPNRRMFDRVLTAEVDRAMRSHADLSLVMLDLDHFKRVNDTYGHDCGDIVLARLGQVLKASVRSYDTAARIGGEEFAVILPSTPGWTAVLLAKRILETFRAEIFTCNGQEFRMTFSAGVASINLLDGKPSPSLLLKTADKALYETKRNGRNQVGAAETKRTGSAFALVQSQEKQFLFECKGTE